MKKNIVILSVVALLFLSSNLPAGANAVTRRALTLLRTPVKVIKGFGLIVVIAASMIDAKIDEVIETELVNEMVKEMKELHKKLPPPVVPDSEDVELEKV